jgi:hypothetical protein
MSAVLGVGWAQILAHLPSRIFGKIGDFFLFTLLW